MKINYVYLIKVNMGMFRVLGVSNLPHYGPIISRIVLLGVFEGSKGS